MGGGGGSLRERDPMEDLEQDRKIYIHMDLQDWTVLAQERDKWRAVVNAVMNLRLP